MQMSKGTDYLTVVIRMPKDAEDRKRLSATLQLGGKFCGGQITGMSLEDEMTVLECIEQHEDFDESIAEDARAKTKQIHAAAEAALEV
jgi:hypothetical protein